MTIAALMPMWHMISISGIRYQVFCRIKIQFSRFIKTYRSNNTFAYGHRSIGITHLLSKRKTGKKTNHTDHYWFYVRYRREHINNNLRFPTSSVFCRYRIHNIREYCRTRFILKNYFSSMVNFEYFDLRFQSFRF